MKHSTTSYTLYNDEAEIIFNSEQDACKFLGVTKCTVASCFRRKVMCKGYHIKRNGRTSHLSTKTRLFKIWESMHERCERKNHVHYKDYGGRGISVCEEWTEFIPFRDWAMDNGYKETLTIDRIDCNGNYSPNNCRWVTNKEQQNNRRDNRKLTFNGEEHTISEWANITKINKTTIRARIDAGWAIEDILTKSVKKRHNKHDRAKIDEEDENDQ